MITARLRQNLIASSRRQFVSLAHPRTQPIHFRPASFSQAEVIEEDFYLPFGLQRKPNKSPVKESRYTFSRRTDLIGSGFFAEVFRAKDTLRKQSVAVKVINKKTCPKEVYAQEVKVMTQISALIGSNHSGLCLCRDVLESGDEIQLVFDLKTGGDMFDEVVSNGPLDESEAQVLLLSLCNSIKTLHDAGFVHRDIKLENLLLNSGSHARAERLSTVALSDFGYARALSGEDSFTNPAGTYGYVAPEVLSSREYSTAGDVWSLGTVLFTSVAGYQPFPYKSKLSTGAKTKEVIAREIEAINHGTTEDTWQSEMQKPNFKSKSAQFQSLLRTMLDPNPETRITVAGILSHPWMTMKLSAGVESKYMEA